MAVQQGPSLEEILLAVENIFDKAVAMLSEFVAIDSTLNHETAAIAFMEARFQELGLITDRFPVVLDSLRSLPGFSPVNWSYEGKECVVGVHRPRLPPKGIPPPSTLPERLPFSLVTVVVQAKASSSMVMWTWFPLDRLTCGLTARSKCGSRMGACTAVVRVI